MGVGDNHSQTYPVLAADNRSTQVPYSSLKDRFEHFGIHFDSMMIILSLSVHRGDLAEARDLRVEAKNRKTV